MKLNILSLAATIVLLPLTFLRASYYYKDELKEIKAKSLYELKLYFESQKCNETLLKNRSKLRVCRSVLLIAHDYLYSLCSVGDAHGVTNCMSSGISSLGEGYRKHACFNMAVLGNHPEVVKLILDENIEAASEAVDMAAQYGCLQVLPVLLSDQRVNVSTIAVELAARNGHIEILKLLLAYPGIVFTDYKVLEAAASSGHKEIVEVLAFKKIVACPSGHIETVELLLSDVRIHPEYSKALRLAVEAGHEEITRLLLKDGRCCTNINVGECLKRAVYSGHEEIIKIILSDERAQTEDFEFALVQAIEYEKFTSILSMLLKVTSKEMIEGLFGYLDPFTRATKHANIEAVKILLADGRADPTANGYSGLKYAWSSRPHRSLFLAKGHRSMRYQNPLYLEAACLILADERVDPAYALHTYLPSDHPLAKCRDGDLASFQKYVYEHRRTFLDQPSEVLQVLIKRNSRHWGILRFIRETLLSGLFEKLIDKDEGFQNMLFNVTIKEAWTRDDLKERIEKYVNLKGMKRAVNKYGYGDEGEEDRNKNAAYAILPDKFLVQIAFTQ